MLIIIIFKKKKIHSELKDCFVPSKRSREDMELVYSFSWLEEDNHQGSSTGHLGEPPHLGQLEKTTHLVIPSLLSEDCIVVFSGVEIIFTSWLHSLCKLLRGI